MGIIWFYGAILRIVKNDAKNHALVKRLAKMCAVLSTVYFVSTFPDGTEIVYSLVTGARVLVSECLLVLRSLCHR